MSWFSVLTWVAGAMLGMAAMLALYRAARGPTMPNRAVALDVLVSVLIGALGLEAAYQRDSDTLPILAVLSLVGIVGSVSIARFATARDVDEPEDAAAHEPAVSASQDGNGDE